MSDRHFEDGGESYAKYRPTYPPALAKAIADLTDERRLALDVGCGTGQFSVLLADHFDQVHASDVSRTQIENAERKANVTYKIGSAEMIDAHDQSADLIVAAQAAHWFDLAAFYDEAKRVGKPGGVLALVTYGVLSVDGPARDRIDRFYWQEIHPFWPDGRQHVETGYRAFAFPFEPIEAPALVIEREWTAADFVNYCRTWSSVKRAEQNGRADLLETLEADLRALMRPDETMAVRWPISVRAGCI